ncbi:hypothetical protein [Maribellus maritimus]|uniref:hypothetical protein n=1 Tax=Maribellus maritimus TaxID=2870838 RepID=UPI001EEA55D8|nr:hypothetical protein [Maribellus maritimus]MCG6189386.1 hypothetical protein [Maribellus maritimus]
MNTKEYIKELSIVIVGILIALWINNIWTRHEKHTTQKQVLTVIQNELNDNKQQTKITLDNLNQLLGNFEKIQKLASTLGSYDVSIKYTGSNLKSIGYETAKYTGILKDIDYKLMSEIVEYYEIQKETKDLETSIRDEIFIFFKNTSPKNIDYLILKISNLIENIKNLDAIQNQLSEELTEHFDESK